MDIKFKQIHAALTTLKDGAQMLDEHLQILSITWDKYDKEKPLKVHCYWKALLNDKNIVFDVTRVNNFWKFSLYPMDKVEIFCIVDENVLRKIVEEGIYTVEELWKLFPMLNYYYSSIEG